MSTIEGGMVSTNNKEFYETVRILRSHGMLRENDNKKNEKKIIKKYPQLSPKFIFLYPAYNLRNNEISAVIGINQLKRLAAREISSGIQNQQKYFDLVIACLEEPMSEQNSQEPKHIDHLREIINLAHNEKTMESPLSLLEVCKYINTSQASLYRICQEYFGMGIIELMTQIRLEESRRIMLNQEARQKLNLLSIRDIAIKYGFKHQGRYARRYYTAFGELPSQTIEKSRRYKLPI